MLSQALTAQAFGTNFLRPTVVLEVNHYRDCRNVQGCRTLNVESDEYFLASPKVRIYPTLCYRHPLKRILISFEVDEEGLPFAKYN